MRNSSNSSSLCTRTGRDMGTRSIIRRCRCCPERLQASTRITDMHGSTEDRRARRVELYTCGEVVTAFSR